MQTHSFALPISITRDGTTVALTPGMLGQLPMCAMVKELYGGPVKRPARIWSNHGPTYAVRPRGGTGFSMFGYDEIVISDDAPSDTTVVWIDTSGV